MPTRANRVTQVVRVMGGVFLNNCCKSYVMISSFFEWENDEVGIMFMILRLLIKQSSGDSSIELTNSKKTVSKD